MCQVGTVIMTAPRCNHERQSGWQDEAVGTYLRGLITRCSSCKPDQTFCGQLTITNGRPSKSNPPSSRSQRMVLPMSLASLVQYTPPEADYRENALHGKCKFCAVYDSEIRLADQIKQTLMDYNMALLFDDARIAIQAEMERAFQHAVDEAVRVYGIEGKAREKALRILDSGYQKASAEISRICGEKQLAPYRELYGR